MNFNEAARNHVQSEWHKKAVSDGTNLMAIKKKTRNEVLLI
jgi:hypothetical protein